MATGIPATRRATATSARKSTTSAKAAAKPDAATPAGDRADATPVAVEAGEVIDSSPVSTAPHPKKPDLRKKELLEQVVARSGIRRKDAKPVVEAMLAVLGETLAEGRELNLQPLGKLRINRHEEKSGFRIVVCKLRQSKRPPGQSPDVAPGPETDNPLADKAE